MVISHHLAQAADEVFDGAVELDESYVGGQRKGRGGRGAAGKVAVFGILKWQGQAYIAKSLQTVGTTLTVSRISGIRQSAS